MNKWAPITDRQAGSWIWQSFHAIANHLKSGHSGTRLPARADSAQSHHPARHSSGPPSTLEKPPTAQTVELCLKAAANLGCKGCRDACDRERYLLKRGNLACDIEKLNRLLRMPRIVLEVGCGDAGAAFQIALRNPNIGVIATDIYDWSHLQPGGGVCYGTVAETWRDRRLSAQVDTLSNLVVLRADAELLRCLPVRSIDTILLLNPEASVGKSFLELIQGGSLSLKVKIGPAQIVILPYSRELGVMACGGFSFEHDPDWSRGLGFMMGSGLNFKKGDPVHWGVDLSCVSAYTRNSTQRDIYICGELPN